jgi:hypothetical protein
VRSLASEQTATPATAAEEPKRPELVGFEAVARPRPALQK